MKIVFQDFATKSRTLPDGSVALTFDEAMEGEGPDGEVGIVGTGNSFEVRLSKDVGLNFMIELSVQLGLMQDQDKPDVASVSDFAEEIKKRRRPKR